MNRVLAVRDALVRFYGKYDTFLRVFGKFLVASAAFFSIRAALGQMRALNNPLLLLLLAAACALLPSNAVILVGAALAVGHFFGISLEVGIVGGGFALVALLLYFSIAPESAWPFVLTAMALGAHMGCVPAVACALVSGPLGAVGVAFGAFFAYLVRTAAQSGGSLQATSTEAAEAMLQRMAQFIQAVLSNREMPVAIAALAVAFVTAYAVHVLAIRYAWMVAAAAGCAAYVLITCVLSAAFSLPIPVMWLLAETAAALFAAFVAQFLLFHLDYKKTENVRFEDDAYYYYVKAVPKKKVRHRRRRRRAERR